MNINIDELVNNPELLEVARLAVEDELIKRRDARIAQLRANGLCIREKDGRPSPIIRMGMETALVVALKAIKKHHEEAFSSAKE